MTPPTVRNAIVAAAALVALAAASFGCAGRRGDRDEGGAEALTARVLYDRASLELAKRNLRKARTLLERIQFAAEDRQVLEPLVRLSLADAVFYQGDDLSLIEARSKYLDFVTLYGDHPSAPYAQFQAGMCSLKQVRAPTRDQSQTMVALGDLKEVTRRYPRSRFSRAATDAIRVAEGNLAEHEFLVGRFYLRRKNYRAASARFREVLDKYPAYRDKDKLYFYLGRSLLEGDTATQGKAYLDRVIDDYPESAFADEARKLLAEDGKSTASGAKDAS